jgi:uracil-DNA glycosylase
VIHPFTHIKFKDTGITIHESWKPFFDCQSNELKRIEDSIGDKFTPSIDDIFKIFKLPIQNIKFVIIGQDPYPQKGTATGRSFEINQDSWNYVNPSLEAILVSIYYHRKNELLSYCNIINKINSGEWNILPPNQLFSELENQSGCFFLNKSLTCIIGKKNTHEKIWHKFTKQLVSYVSITCSPHWLLWGDFSYKLAVCVMDEKAITRATHPAYFSYTSGAESEQRLFDFALKSGLNRILTLNSNFLENTS